jgi:hypothetical protein
MEWKAEYPDELNPRDVISRTLWLLHWVDELTVEVLEVRVAEGGR